MTASATPLPAPERALAALEAKLGSSLPPVLKRRYATANGGTFSDPHHRDQEWRLHPVFDANSRQQMKRTAEDILHYTQLALKDSRFPRNGISIAHDYSLMRQLLVLRDEASGVIKDEIFLFDVYSGQWCKAYASDLQQAVDQGRIPGLVQPDPVRPFPSFRYYADPFASGVFCLSGETCECCGKATGYIYQGSFYAVGAEARFCPWCVADGSAAAKFDGEFNDAAGVGMGECELARAVIDEVSQRTPSFFSFQQEQWWAHCDDAGCFLGEIEHLDREKLGTEASRDFERDIRQALNCEADADWQLFLHTPSSERDVAVFVFGCLHCGRLGGYADHS